MPSSRSSARAKSVSVSYVSIEELKADPRNARLHSKAQIRQLAASIEAFGFNVPILVDAQGNVLAGHARLLACQQLCYAQIPIIRLEHLSAAQARAFQLADNRLAEVATWDKRNANRIGSIRYGSSRNALHHGHAMPSQAVHCSKMSQVKLQLFLLVFA